MRIPKWIIIALLMFFACKCETEPSKFAAFEFAKPELIEKIGIDESLIGFPSNHEILNSIKRESKDYYTLDSWVGTPTGRIHYSAFVKVTNEGGEVISLTIR